MIHPSHSVQVFVETKPVGFRKRHDGLVVLVQKRPLDPEPVPTYELIYTDERH